MGASKLLLASCLLALLAVAAIASPSLEDIESDVMMLEAAAAPSVESVLADAQAYAKSKLDAAVESSKTLLASAAAEGRKQAAEQGPAPAQPALSSAARERIAVKVALEAKRVEAQAVKAAAQKAAAKTARKRLAAAAGFRSAKAKPDAQGVFGAVRFGVPKAESSPVPAAASKAARSAFNKFDKFGKKKDIYGRKKSCLKDIAAHFDEADIYESKKLRLLQRLEHSKSRSHARRLRNKLRNLETWHQMMQKKFTMSEQQAKDHQRRMERLFDTHLPQELKDKLKANKLAKRAGQKLPFPTAHKEALKVLRTKRSLIERDQRNNSRGVKKMIRPELTNKGFPSMDPISSSLREKLWRNVNTEKEWSTEKADLERAENVITAAHKAHGDFVDGPIAEPMLRGKLYKPDTEPLGVPNFLVHFPWPKQEEKVTMNDKVRVEQTYHQTW